MDKDIIINHFLRVRLSEKVSDIKIEKERTMKTSLLYQAILLIKEDF